MTDASIVHILTNVVTITAMITGFLTLWVKLKYSAQKAKEAVARAEIVEHKIDENTEITKEGTRAAATNAKEAAVTARVAADKASMAANKAVEIAEKVDGGFDAKMKEFSGYVHQRNHDILDAMQTHTNMLKILMVRLEEEKAARTNGDHK